MAKLYSDPLWAVRSRVSHLAGLYRETGNVAAAWTSFHVARSYGIPVPDAVAAEVERFAAAIAGVVDSAMAGDRDARLDSRTVARLWAGETAGRGKNEPAGSVAEWQRDIAAAVDVIRTRNGGATEASAVVSVADARNMSESAVRTAVRRFQPNDEDLSPKDAI